MPQSERPVGRVEEGAQRGRNPVGYGARVVTACASCRRQAAFKVLSHIDCNGLICATLLSLIILIYLGAVLYGKRFNYFSK